MSAHSKCFFAKKWMFVKYFYFIYFYFYYLWNWNAAVEKSVDIFVNAGVIYFQNALSIYEDWFITIFGGLIEPKVGISKKLELNVEEFKLLGENGKDMIKVPTPACKKVKCNLYITRDRSKEVRKIRKQFHHDNCKVFIFSCQNISFFILTVVVLYVKARKDVRTVVK